MKLQFVNYDTKNGTLIFDIIADQTEINNSYHLKIDLFKAITLHGDAQIMVENNRITISRLHGTNHIEFLLNNMKKCCEARGVTNGLEFSGQIKSKCNIHAKTTSQYNNLNKLPGDILRLISSKYIGLYSRPAMMQINKEITNKINHPEEILKIQFPDIYFSEKKSNSDKVNNKRHFQQVFMNAYNNELEEKRCNHKSSDDFSREMKLLVLFKHGDLPAIIKSGETLRSLAHSQYPLLYWAYRNGHRNVLDYFYQTDSPGISQLDKAIYCFQDTATLASILKISDMEGPRRYRRGGFASPPLEIAARINNLPAIEFLCQQPGVQLDELGSSSNTPLAMALRRDNIEIVKYLCDRGAKLYADRSIPYTDFFDFAGPKSRKYLCEHPIFALELLDVGRIEKGWISISYRERTNHFYKKEVSDWLENYKEDSLLAPLHHFFNGQDYKSITEYGVKYTVHVFATLIIKQAERASPEEVVNLISKIEKYNCRMLVKTLAELKNHFTLLCNQNKNSFTKI